MVIQRYTLAEYLSVVYILTVFGARGTRLLQSRADMAHGGQQFFRYDTNGGGLDDPMSGSSSLLVRLHA